MFELVDAYIKFLQSYKEVNRPVMPKFDEFAYTESEYLNTINSFEEDYKFVDDLGITEHFLEGD